MSTSQIIHDTTIKKLSDFKNIHKYTSYYQASFNKVHSYLTEISSYTCKSTTIHFQATMLINIGIEYLVLVLSIQKDWKDKNTNLAEVNL